jgi:hypothetical protein
VERLLLVCCSGLEEEDEGGQALRALVEVVRTLEAYCPWVEPVRPGVCTLPARGPARYFGGEPALVEELTRALDHLDLEVDRGRTSIGIAEGLFGAGLAARAGVVVAPGETPAFLAGWPVTVLDRPELTDLLERLGLRTLGDLAALPSRHVLARFGGEGVLCHRMARGEDGELFGLRTPGLGRRLRELSPGGRGTPADRQPGFWGGLDDQGRRAARALAEVGELLGPAAVLTARLQGGRSPLDRVRLVPWDPSADPRSVDAGLAEVGRPWPGRLPPPAPTALYRTSIPAEVGGPDGTGVRVSGRGALSAPPARLSIDGGPWTAILRWAGPWPVMERWWARSGRRLARLQVVTEDGRAHLLAAEGPQWRVEATYA